MPWVFFKLRDRNTSMNTDLSSGRDGGWVEVITGVQCRRRCTPEESPALVKQTRELGMTVSLVARMAGIAATQLFQWKKAYSEGSLVAVGDNEPVVPASEMVEALKRIKQREAAPGRKTLGKRPINDVLVCVT